MNIYIGNLSYEVTEEDLKQAFETFGEVESVKIIKQGLSRVVKNTTTLLE